MKVSGFKLLALSALGRTYPPVYVPRETSVSPGVKRLFQRWPFAVEVRVLQWDVSSLDWKLERTIERED